MAQFIEAVPGTAFLFPIVWYLVSSNIFEVTSIMAVAAFLVFPMGWIILSIQGFLLACLYGRYENEPVMKHFRKNIKVMKKNCGESYYIDLNKVLPLCFKKRIITCSKQEYEKIFDPFKKLRYFPCSYRRKQEQDGEKPYYVENVENVTYFSEEVPFSYIREVIRYWHVATSSGMSVLLGILVTIELAATLSGEYPIIIFGWATLISTLMTLVFFAGFQSYLRRKEAIANEFLFIKLMIPYSKAPPSATLS